MKPFLLLLKIGQSYQYQMISKWVIYALTFLSYATFHSVRAAWAGLKNMLFNYPFNYSQAFLGAIDMTVVLVLAVTLTTLGHKVEKHGPKRCLIGGMTILMILTAFIAILMLSKVTSGAVYLIIFGIVVGFVSASGWPSCLYLLSQRFDKKNNTALPIWNGTSQFGDFLALFISDIIIDNLNANGAITLLIIAAIMSVLIGFNYFYLTEDWKQITIQLQNHNVNQLVEQKDIKTKPIDNNVKYIGNKQTQIKLATINLQDNINLDVNNNQASSAVLQQRGQQNPSFSSLQEYSSHPVNFISVWTLPGVLPYAFISATVKSINAIIMTWLVFYLSSPQMNMKEQSRIIAILWAFGVFGGGIIGGIVNPTYKKEIFVASLAISAVMFFTLQGMHQKIDEMKIIFAIVFCSLAYGGPFSMLGTSIPLMLGQNQEIKNRLGAKSAIISLMEGFPLAVSAISILIVPFIGVQYIHFVLMGYCIVACGILIVCILKQKQMRLVPFQSSSEREQQENQKKSAASC